MRYSSGHVGYSIAGRRSCTAAITGNSKTCISAAARSRPSLRYSLGCVRFAF